MNSKMLTAGLLSKLLNFVPKFNLTVEKVGILGSKTPVADGSKNLLMIGRFVEYRKSSIDVLRQTIKTVFWK